MLKDIHSPEALKSMSFQELEDLAEEIRSEIVKTTSERGGHLASNLGVVELTIALHRVFSSPRDKIIFDVGHQAYAHKLLTGRYDRFHTLRTKDGISGFPDSAESEHDAFTAGHASTAISAALGYARTRDIMGGTNHVIAVVGDGALTGGMCYEALNDAGQSGTRLIVILNDNEMSISKNVGAMSHYLTNLRQSRGYRAFKRGLRRAFDRIPAFGPRVFRFLDRFKDTLRMLLIDGRFFEALGFEYIGTIDGSDIKRLTKVLSREKDSTKPVLIHVVTRKGRGYAPAEENPASYHGVSPHSGASGVCRSSDIVGQELAALAENDIRVTAITAAMASGTGLTGFAEKYPERFFDVGIAEEHAVTLAAGMAASGMRPYAAIYSTFLERAYDQILVDVCRPRLPVTFLIDRAGLVGPDGATHQGAFDLSYLRSMPNMTIAAPRDVRDLKVMLRLSLNHDAPLAIRYPRTCEDMGARLRMDGDFRMGEWEVLSSGSDVMIFAVGSTVQSAMNAAIELNGHGISAGVTDARFVKPMDIKKLESGARAAKLVVTMEEGALSGGFGEGVAAHLAESHILRPVVRLGIPDRFIPHATEEEQKRECGLDATSVAERIAQELRKLNINA